MTVDRQISKQVFYGNGAAREFALHFPVPEAPIGAKYIYLTLSDEDGSNPASVETGYEIVRVNDLVTIRYPLTGAALPEGKKLTVARVLPLTQGTSLEPGGAFSPEVVEGTFDYSRMVDQQLQEEISRAIKVPISDNGPPLSAEDFYNNIDALIEDGKAGVQAIADEAQEYADEARRQADRAESLVDPSALASQVYNIRRAWLATDAVVAGDVLTLQGPYYPGRDVLSLKIGSIPCTPKHAVIDASAQYQYEEIGSDPNTLSYQVRVWFDVKPGDLIDMHVIASGVSLQEFEELVAEAREASDEAAAAQAIAEAAAAAAVVAANKLPDAADAEAGQTIVARMVGGALVWVSEFPSGGGGDWAELRVTLASELAAGTALTVPQYVVGSSKLLVYYGGVLCDPGMAQADGFYQHIGNTGEQSTAISFFETLPVGRKLAVIVAA